ncbi:MAG: AMP-binding protein, partial [Xanthobacteraceae bacterium]|nr:AMP-binding protein [Xanthobacteraceae bacterium]
MSSTTVGSAGADRRRISPGTARPSTGSWLCRGGGTMRLIDFFDRGVSLYPSRACLCDLSGRSLSFKEVQQLTFRIGNKLIANGLAPEGVGAVLSPNDVDAFACILGILRGGGAWMPLNARNSVEDNVHILADNECRWLFYHSSFAKAVEEIRARVPGLTGLVCIDRANGSEPGLGSWLAEASEEAFYVPATPHDITSIWPSGGTTGRSKGVMLTHLNFETMISNFVTSMPYDEPPVHLVAAPMTHAAGCIAFPLLAMGATQIIIPSADPLQIMRSIERFKVTTLFLPPTVIYMMLGHPRVREFDYSSLRHFIYAAAPMSARKLQEALEVFGPVMAQTFRASRGTDAVHVSLAGGARRREREAPDELRPPDHVRAAGGHGRRGPHPASQRARRDR